jgi:hypothetical protein
MRAEVPFARSFSPKIQARLLAVALAFIAIIPAVAEQPGETHAWKRIAYPNLSVPDVPGGLTVDVDTTGHGSEPSLRFSVHWGARRGDFQAKPPIEAEQMAVLLHLSDGTTVPSKLVGNRWIGVSMGGGVDYMLMYFFPWSRNRLEEGWIEFRLPQQTYWVELPYGFTRNPADPMLADPDHGSPEFPPEMKNLPDKDVLVPWLFVEYDLGQIPNNARVSLHVSNPFQARAEAILYREKGRWDLHTPRTTMEVQWGKAGRDAGHIVGIRLTDLMRRTDDYLIRSGPEGDRGRLWGKIVVKVEEATCECAVPSSLFKYTHGITDPYHKQRMPRPRCPRMGSSSARARSSRRLLQRSACTRCW